MSDEAKVRILEIVAERDWQMANVPMSPSKHHIRAKVMYGREQYLVRDYGGRDATVTHMFSARGRPMRDCARRQRILAVLRAHASYQILRISA